jgi:hypothetical protein
MTLARPFEDVFAITDYFDHPLRGVANFDGLPHGYELLFDDQRGEYEVDLYDLRPIDDDTYQLALEYREIWIRWQEAWLAGKVALDRQTALPEDRARHAELAQLLDGRLAALSGAAIRARARFRHRDNPADGSRKPGLEVQWTPVSQPACR